MPAFVTLRCFAGSSACSNLTSESVVIRRTILLGATLVALLSTPLAQAQTLAQRIAAGDLSSQEAVVRGDEFGDLLRALNP